MENRIVKVIFGVIILLLVSIFFLRNFKFYRIDGHSMNPTIYHSNIVIGIRPKNIERGDIISFKHDNKIAIKRVIGIPNDKINIKEDGTVIVNDEVINEPYISKKEINRVEVTFPITLGDDEYFVLGDNRIDSLDSKNFKVGNIKEEDIEAKIIFCLNSFKKL